MEMNYYWWYDDLEVYISEYEGEDNSDNSNVMENRWNFGKPTLDLRFETRTIFTMKREDDTWFVTWRWRSLKSTHDPMYSLFASYFEVDERWQNGRENREEYRTRDEIWKGEW